MPSATVGGEKGGGDGGGDGDGDGGGLVGDGDGVGGGGECRRNLDVPRLAFARERRASRTSGTASDT